MPSRRGLYANIHAKRKRIKAGSKEKMRKRYASQAKPPKKGLWSRLRSFFTGR